MDLSTIEDSLHASLDRGGLDAGTLRQVLAWEEPDDLASFAGVGLDTNALKQLRRNRTLADRLTSNLKEMGVSLIVPDQSISEFWNNHETFYKEDWGQVSKEVEALRKRLTELSVENDLLRKVEDLETGVTELRAGFQASRTKDFLARSYEMIDLLIDDALVPRVSRTRFSDLSEIRQLAKRPPGFADEARKFATRGDFFVWCEFLAGVMRAKAEKPERGDWFLLVTDETKPDWKTGERIHPGLASEAFDATGARVALVSTKQLDAMVTRAAAALDAQSKPKPEDE